MCDYNKYNNDQTGGTSANYHVLPLFTESTDECQRYFDNTISEHDYSQLKSKDGSKVLGYICLPWCDVDKGKCSSSKVQLNSDNTWTVNGQKTDYKQRINKYQPKGNWTDNNNRCVLLNDGTKKCSFLDAVCCGLKFENADGSYCDRLSQNELFLTTCHNEGKRGECCDHGVCTNGICVCDPGYTGNCCNCADGYHKDGNGNCVPDDVYCCNQTTFQVSQVPPDQCTGPNNKVVPDGTADNCWPKGKSWCSTDKNTCVDITMPFAWKEVRDKPGVLINNCESCFPSGLYYCNNKPNCASSSAALKTSETNGKSSNGNDSTPYFFAGALAIILFCFVIFIILCLNKKKK